MASTTAIPKESLTSYYLLAAAIILSTALGLYTETWVLAVAPVLFLISLVIVKDFRVLYFGFFALLPFSVEVELGSLGTDLPSEPMMLALTGIGLLLFFKNIKHISVKVFYHPITLLMLMHISWILIAAIFSQIPVISFKFFLAKLWYIIPFYFLGFYMLRQKADIENVFKAISIGLTVAVSIVLVRHAANDFSFDTSNEVVYPIFRNHVNYAAMLVAVIPYVWVIYKKYTNVWTIAAMSILVLGTYFSYTRAAHACLFIMIGAYFIFKYRLGKLALGSSAVVAVLLISFLTTENRYLNFAPDFEKTISHDKFDNLIEATYKLEDISTMERVYRWVAGGHMISERPMLGYGPSGFYHNYTKFTLASFETYVSNNPEKSGIHNYYRTSRSAYISCSICDDNISRRVRIPKPYGHSE